VPPKYFTVGEANALLPTLRPILQKIAEKRRELQAKREALAVFRHQAAGNGHHLASPDFLALRKEAEFIGEELRAEIQKVHDLGCQLKDLDLLLVDFPALRAGREILLYIVSLGIYGFVWTFKTLDEIRRHTGQGVGGVGALVGANPIVAVFLVPYEVRKMYELDGRTSPVMGTVGWWFLLVPIAGPFIWFGKVQGALNDYWVSKGAQPV